MIFFEAGSLRFLGISLGQYLHCKSLIAADGAERSGAGVHSAMAGRRPESHRYLGPETQKFIQGHFDQRARNPGLRVAPASLRAHGQARDDPVHAHRGVDHPGSHPLCHDRSQGKPAQCNSPSIGSIIAKEMGSRNSVPAYVKVPKNQHDVDEYFKAASSVRIQSDATPGSKR